MFILLIYIYIIIIFISLVITTNGHYDQQARLASAKALRQPNANHHPPAVYSYGVYRHGLSSYGLYSYGP